MIYTAHVHATGLKLLPKLSSNLFSSSLHHVQGNCEQKVLDFAAQSAGAVQSCVLKPGLIFGPGRDGLILRGFQAVLGILVGLPSLDVTDMAATALKLAIDGPTKDTFDNRDLIQTAREARGESASSPGPSN